MLYRTSITLIAAVCLIAAAAALVPGSQAPTAVPKDDIAYGSHEPRYIKGKLLQSCFDEPVECGLVVW